MDEVSLDALQQHFPESMAPEEIDAFMNSVHCLVTGCPDPQFNGWYKQIQRSTLSPYSMRFRHLVHSKIRIERISAEGKFGWVIGRPELKDKYGRVKKGKAAEGFGKANYVAQTEQYVPPEHGWKDGATGDKIPKIHVRCQVQTSVEQARRESTARRKSEATYRHSSTAAAKATLDLEMVNLENGHHHKKDKPKKKKKKVIDIDDDMVGFSQLNAPRIKSGGYAYDVGPDEFNEKNNKFISYAYAQESIKAAHPMDKSTGLKFNIYQTNMGSHLPFCGGASAVKDYGVGMVLYFKYLRFMSWIFFIFAFLSIPSMVFYAMAGSLKTSWGVDAFGILTMGNLGEGIQNCQEITIPAGFTGDWNVEIACADPNGDIAAVEAFYGEPTGYCSCPFERAAKIDAAGTAVCSNETKFNITSKRTECPYGAYCHVGEHPVSQEMCCSNSLNEHGYGDMTDMRIGASSTCNYAGFTATLQTNCLQQHQCKTNLTIGDSLVNITNATEQTCFRERSSEAKQLKILALCQVRKISIPFVEEPMPKTEVSLWVVTFDFLASFIAFLGFIYLEWREGREVKATDESTCTPEDYTVLMDNLPRLPRNKAFKKGEDDHRWRIIIKKHFKRVLKNMGKVAEINFGYNDGRIISQFIKRGKNLHKLESAYAAKKEAEAEHWSSHLKSAKKLIAKYEERVNLIDEKIAELKEKNKRPVCAFISFENDKAVDEALHMYPSNFFVKCCMSEKHKMVLDDRRSHEVHEVDSEDEEEEEEFDKIVFGLKHADNPQNILWENLDTGFYTQAALSTATFLFTIILLAVSFVGIVSAKAVAESQTLRFPEVQCDKFATETSTWTNENWRDNIYLDEMIGDRAITNQTEKKGLLSCYCSALLIATDPASQSAFWSPETPWPVVTTPLGTPHTANWCSDWFIGQVALRGAQFLSVGGVVMINLLLKTILRYFAKLERHHRISGKDSSVAIKVFLAQFVNTALIVLIVNGNLRDFGIEFDKEGLLGSLSLFTGEFGDFTMKWYTKVGSQLCLTMVINIMFPLLQSLQGFVVSRVKQCFDRKCTPNPTVTKQRTLAKYVKLYTGPKFLLAEQYAMLLNTCFICLFFGSGMPILYVVGFLTYTFTYWVDKWGFVTVFSTPPQYDSAIASLTTRSLPYALLAHVGVGLWMYSNPDLFPDIKSAAAELDTLDASFNIGDGYLQRRINRITTGTPHIFVLLVLIILYLIVTRIVLKSFKKILSTICPCIMSDSDEENPKFSVKKKEYEEKNLPFSYNIMDNKDYAAKFGDINALDHAADLYKDYNDPWKATTKKKKKTKKGYMGQMANLGGMATDAFQSRLGNNPLKRKKKKNGVQKEKNYRKNPLKAKKKGKTKIIVK